MENDKPADALTSRAFGPGDMAMAAAWWGHRHPSPFPAGGLPPLGVVVEDKDGPACMLWCYECYGVGVAFLEFLITRPALSVKQARTVGREAVTACCAMAGQMVEPPCAYKIFRAATTAPLFRELSRMGFHATDDGAPLRGLALILP